jgi:hypothetical protein
MAVATNLRGIPAPFSPGGVVRPSLLTFVRTVRDIVFTSLPSVSTAGRGAVPAGAAPAFFAEENAPA